MSDEQQEQPDDSEPTPERQAELRAAYQANVAAGKAPYAGVVINTRGEVDWIVRERGWGTYQLNTAEEAIDFRYVGIGNAILLDMNLALANLSGATLSESNFKGANLVSIDLSSAKGYRANFSHADMSGADLSGATITGNFSGADLTAAKLASAAIAGNFSGADLTQARMDSTTVLGATGSEDTDDMFQLDGATRLLDVAWNGAILANVRWEQLRQLGDERAIKEATSRAARIEALRSAARAYRGLAKALQAQGLIVPAIRYRTREQQLERRAQLYSLALGPWAFSWLLNIVSGYGDKPGRALACYLAVVGAFTAAYWAITNQVFGLIHSQSTHLAWYEALVLSISSFHGRGFFPSMLSLGDPIALVAAAEAIIGLFIELVFIATFTQRFFAR